MMVFHSDLDNTMIYSYKHDIGNEKRCVEIYQGREISYVTDRTHELLRQVQDRVLFVPTTTRTTEQYRRIDLGIGPIRYALTCNGGELLVDGQEDETWYQESLVQIRESRDELARAEKLLEEDLRRSLEVRNIRGLFLFTKSEQPMESVAILRQGLNTGLVDVFSNGTKVYVVPVRLNKGTAVRRFRKKIAADGVIAAGDSEFDLPMLAQADIGFAPEGLRGRCTPGETVLYMGRDRIFSESILEYIRCWGQKHLTP
ncbi:MAG: HAD hydrolase family protein [Blautia sp.]|nr:HAD hydrolase family protein [Blautia sp.]